jgi:hypothetical protein
MFLPLIVDWAVSLPMPGLASAEVVEFVGERRAEATVGESGAGAPLG